MVTSIEAIGKIQNCYVKSMKEVHKEKQLIYKTSDKQGKNRKEMREE